MFGGGRDFPRNRRDVPALSLGVSTQGGNSHGKHNGREGNHRGERVEGSAVYGADDEKIGEIERVMIDKISGKVATRC
jgi:hypothetical protein